MDRSPWPSEHRATPTRVLVCGTTFGRLYLRAVQRLAPSFALAGILARGSEYSRTCADQAGVLLFTSIDELPEAIDIACVVVRAGAVGGPGAELAQKLLARGIHVLQEQPLHHDELAACLRTARRHDVQYQLNSLFPHLPAIRRFLAAAQRLRSRQTPAFIDAVCAPMVLFPLLDLLGRVLSGLKPWAFDQPAPLSNEVRARAVASAPFRSLHGVLGGIPTTLRVQNQAALGDADNHAHTWLRISIGCEGGVLTLADAHGPVLWSPRLHMRRDPADRIILDGPDAHRLDVVSTSIIGPAECKTYRALFSEDWPDAIGETLLQLQRAATQRTDPMQRGQGHLTACRIWQDVTVRLGEPDLLSPNEPRPLELTELVEGIP